MDNETKAWIAFVVVLGILGVTSSIGYTIRAIYRPVGEIREIDGKQFYVIPVK